MRKSYFLILLGVVACTQQPADYFVLRGMVPGAMDSTMVSLKKLDGRSKLITGYIIGEKFELSGKLDVPTRCELVLDNYDYLERSGGEWESGRRVNIDFFVENGKLTFTTPHLDSLPESFWKYDIRKEKNYKVEGSKAQDVYCRYQQQTIPVRYNIFKIREKEKLTLDDNRQLNDLLTEYREIGKKFIRDNSNIAVNLYIVEGLKKSAFTYDQAYLDELGQLFAATQDTCAGLKNFRQYLHDATRFVKETPLQDGEISDVEGNGVSLLAQLNSNGYTLIDFWASWCGPCRASFPHLREMYRSYGNKVKFVSISIDQKKEDWLKAMEEEKLHWSQFWGSPEFSKKLPGLYDLRGIPTFFFIDPAGKIVFSGHSSLDLEEQLSKLDF